MSKSIHCNRWSSLLHDKNNRGQIYQDFQDNKNALIQHGLSCQKCKPVLVALEPDIDIILDISMDDEDFAQVIRSLWNLARQKSNAP
jgi:hypothetical protein